MLTIRRLKLLAAIAIFGGGGGCDATAQLAKSPEEIPDTPAELQFEDVQEIVGDETLSRFAQSSPSIVVTAFPGAGCDGPPGPFLNPGEIELSIAIPSDAKTGDVFELPSEARPGEGARAAVATMFEQKHSFSFGHGLIVVDERTDEVVKVRIDLASPDGTKKARGAVTAPFCPDK